MKLLFLILVLLYPALSKANCCVPVCKPKVIVKTKTISVEKKVGNIKHHSLVLLLGTGPRNVEVVPNEVRLERNFISGFQYLYTTELGFAFGIQGLTNETALGLVGVAF